MIVSLASDYTLEHIRGRVRGCVHSTFATSFNVELDGFLLHVGQSVQALSCLGVAVAPGEMQELLDVIERGDRAIVRDGVLRLYGRYGMGQIELSGAPVRACRVLSRKDSMAEGLDLSVYRALEQFDLLSLMGLPECAHTTRAISELARYSSICAAQSAGADDIDPMRIAAAERALSGAVEYLVGRGLGLTPSGDDVLCGFGCGLAYLYGGVLPSGVEVFRQVVSENVEGRATAVSEAYLRAMLDGCANADYLDVLGALDSDDTGALNALFERVLATGHTSGADSLLGFAAAFCCLF